MVSSTTPSSGEYLLEMSGINKSFPGVKALDNVNLKVRPHSIHALMGENGAGKSTLLKCLFGIYQKDSGTILFQGKEIDFHSAKEALENGISMVHQELGNDSNLLIVFYVQIMPDDFVMQLHRF